MTNTLGLHNPLRYRGYVYDRETELYYLQSRYYNPQWGRFINADSQLATGDFTGLNLFVYCNNNPLAYTDHSGQAPEWWQWAISGAMFVAGVAMIATGVGGVAGGALVCASVNSIINSYTSEAAGGSSTAGWVGGMITGAICGTGAGVAGNLLTSATNTVGMACIGKAAASLGISFSFGFAGSYAGQTVSAAIDNKPLNGGDSFQSALATGAVNCYAGLGSGIGTAIKDIPLISTTSQVFANALNAGWSVTAEVIVDAFGAIISLFG